MDYQTETEWLELFLRFIKFLRIDSKHIESEGTSGSQFRLWTSQNMFLSELAKGLSRGVRVFYFLKSRQLGVTTISLAVDIFWMAMHPGTIGCLVIDREDNRNIFRSVIRRYIKSFPKGFFGKSFEIMKGGDNRNFIQFTNGSRLDFLVAGTRKNTSWAEGKGYAYGHLCAAKGTPVIVENGRIKAIEDVKIGEKVLTHTGASATVVDVFGQSGVGKPMVKISPWLGSPIKYTTWHKIPTQRGLVQAGELKKDDLLVMPIRKITNDIKQFAMPERGERIGSYAVDSLGRFIKMDSDGAIIRNRKPWSTSKSKIKNFVIEINEELGFSVGYYLSEGYLIHDAYSGKPTGITFTRHRNEKKYADRAIKELANYTTKHRRVENRKNSLTSQDTVYGSQFCEWIKDNFGCSDSKFIPDDVFTWGEDFCRGLLVGVLAGDGSKTLQKNTSGFVCSTMILPTTRSSIAMQTRDIATSLGYGWASLCYKEGGRYYGRNCKPIWRITWNGAAAVRLRALIGLSSPKRKGHDFTNKYIIDGERVLIKIRNITPCKEENEVWDISVDHEDHTFRTPSMSTSNTEVAAYGDSRGLDSFKESMTDSNPNRLYIFESTAKGPNHWFDMYHEAKRDTLTKHSAFIGWWANDLNRIDRYDPRYELYGKESPNEEELEKINYVKTSSGLVITKEQMAWIRWRKSDTSQDALQLNQDQPWDDKECFVQSGQSFFDSIMINKDLKILQEFKPRFRGFKYYLGEDFHVSKMEEITEQWRVDAGEIDLRMWEDPVSGAHYVIGVDAALGRSDDGDRNTIEVFRCYADRLVQVAEYASSMDDTRQCAWVLAYLAGVYQNCRINVDVTGGYGTAIMNELDQLRSRMRSEMYMHLTNKTSWEEFLSSASWYLYHRPDSMGAGYAKGAVWTTKYKWHAVNSYRDSYACGMLIVNSKHLLEEMGNVVRDGLDVGASIAAKGRQKDDRVFAAVLAEIAWKEWIRPMLIQMNYTYDSINKEETAGKADKSADFTKNIVYNFFKRREEASQEFDERPQYLVDRGLA